MGKINIRRHIGDILVKKSIISSEQLKEALEILEQEPQSSSRRLGQILFQDLDLNRHTIMKEIAEIYAFREVLENVESVPEEVIEHIKTNVEEINNDVVDELVVLKAVPFHRSQNSITVAAADPSDPDIQGVIQKLNFKKTELVYCKYEFIEEILSNVYEQKNEFLDLLEEIDYDESQLEAEEEESINEEEIDAEINQSMLNSLVEGMLVESVRQGVSDLHIVPSGPSTTDIRFRTDGKLQLWYQQKNVKPEAISAVVKDKTRNVDRFERDASQDGFIQRQIDGVGIRYRVSIMPIVGNQYDRKFESIVIRVLDDRKVIRDLDLLGLQKVAKANFVKAISQPSGIVIITGPTGSGKSTTLVAALYSVIDPTKNVLTIEEPVEYIIEGARQLKISNHMTFDQSIRGILRHDPDIVLVGEMRDLKTAEIAIKLANTGHLTFSTLHTNDAPSAVSRLFKMGVEPFLIANAVNLVMAQRLVRRLCKECKEEFKPHIEVAKGIGFTEEEYKETTFYKAVGCEVCGESGFKGRSAIHEALYFSKEIKELVLESGGDIDEQAIKDLAMSQGMLTLRGSGRERIKEGITTIEEIIAGTLED
ncbi:MAG: Flp pilus assembly complex ATPase component TadA [Balneola sp.]|nr:Flp pilus assembly complex ATPase component TadA [Balneola sp.]MBO6650738.1 Flp pilus assembly complex ATPase component TadA [Balneola sp.]MBO6710650.1 Flp pilus assembly complex ATPase component TadA [Balneola sp.]MBO6799336.1 Flp pilus assembly complex ATPase component TadA [Balneola sp.]MBO6869535.1 Flp pilus assembly complex ATPase component TadA [Balneola sp.]